MDIVFSIAATAIAVTQALLAFVVHRSTSRRHSQNLDTHRIISIHNWGNDCIDALAEAGEFCLLQRSSFSDDGSYEIRKMDLLYKLSALVDRGRLFYKNKYRDSYKCNRFPARQGLRPEILDPLVAAYLLVQATRGTDQAGKKRLYEWRGRFISLLQYEVDPEWLREERFGDTDGPGTQAGVSLNEASEAPEWPAGRPLP